MPTEGSYDIYSELILVSVHVPPTLVWSRLLKGQDLVHSLLVPEQIRLPTKSLKMDSKNSLNMVNKSGKKINHA